MMFLHRLKGKTRLILGGLLVLFLIAGAIAFNSSWGKENNKNYDEFARCLTEKGVRMYGASWCSHCTNQQSKFGDSFRFVSYVECTQEVKLCTEKDIQGFPTWEFSNQKRLMGEQPLQKLASESGCVLP